MDLELLRQIRKDRKIRQEEVGVALGYKSPSGAYCSIETGVHKATTDQIPIIAKALRMTDQEKLAVFFPESQ